MTSAPRRLGPRFSRGMHASPRALTLATSIAWRHAAADPVRAIILAQRVLPPPLRGGLRLAGPYGRAAALWGAGDRAAALAALDASPRRLAAFSLAVDQPETAAAALTRLADDDRARPVLAARLAWREGRLTEAIETLDRAPGRRARRLRTRLTAERAVLQGDPMIVNSSGQIQSISVHDHESARTKGRVLHLVNDALPTTSAGYTIRTHEIVLAQQAAGLDPHVVTRCGFPVTQGTLDGRRLVTLDGIPYHRLLPWRMPSRADKAAALGLEMAARLTEQVRPSGAARREQLRQRRDRAGHGRAIRAARGVRGARVLGGHLAVPAPRKATTWPAASCTGATATWRPAACRPPTWW